ncbi:bile salt export pump [Aphelenchoides avenae]|nr:bile salt export pump [Aphelenchus avenae]
MDESGEKSREPLLEEEEPRKKKSEDGKKKKDDVKKVSVIQLWRFASKADLLLVAIGCLLAILTGLGLPFLAMIIGGISESFVNATLLLEYPYLMVNVSDELRFFDSVYSLATFEERTLEQVHFSVYIGIVLFFSATLQVMCFSVACENMMQRIRKAFFKSLLRQDIAWHDKHQTGSLATKLFDNLERVKEGTGDKVALAVQYTSQFLGGFLVAFTYDVKMTLIMMSLTPLLIFAGVFLAKLMSSTSTNETRKYAHAGAIAEEVISSIRTVTSFNAQDIECERYAAALRRARVDGILKSVYIGIGFALTFLVMFASYALAFWVGTDFVVDQGMHPETLITVFFAVMMGSMALGQAGPQFAVIGTAQGAAGSIFDIIDRDPEVDPYSAEGVSLAAPAGRVEFTNVQFTYPSRPNATILDGVSFEMAPGETVALVGSSGCGKSTVCSLLLRYYAANTGSISIDGHPIETLNLKHLRNLIGVVSQEPILFDGTIEENIKLGNEEIDDKAVKEACRVANAINFIEHLPSGFRTLVGERGTQLSGGQKQRVAIARAIVRQPKILLLDEATSALDAESEAVVQQALNKASEGRTTLVIAHRLSTVRNAHKILAMRQGQIVESGTHEELMALGGYYYGLINAQVFVDEIEPVTANGTPVNYDASSPRSVTNGSAFSFSEASSPHGRPSLAKGKVTNMEDDLTGASSPKDTKTETKRLKEDLKREGARPSNFWHILRHARPEWGYLMLGVLACIVQGCVFPVFSLFFTNILEIFADVDKERIRSNGHFWAMTFLVLGLVQAATLFVQATCFGLAAERLTMRLRTKLFRHILRMDMAYFDQPTHSSGKICTRLATDTPNVKNAIDYRLGGVFSAFVSVGCGIFLAFYYGWQMALLVIAIFPLGGVGQAFEAKYIRGRSKQDARELENAGKVALEAIEHIRTVQALTLEAYFYSKFCHHLEYPFRSSRVKALMHGLTYGFSSSIFYFLYAAAFRFGVWLIVEGISLPMNVLRTLYAISFTAGGLGFASAYFPEYMKAKLAAGIIFKMLHEDPAIDNLSTGGKRPDKEANGDVGFEQVRFSYPQRSSISVLKGIDLRVPSGQSLAVVGASGCGKSTIVSLLERFYDPLSGSITMDGTDLRELNPGWLRSQMALVSQEPVLFNRTVRENITYGLRDGQFTEKDIEDVIRLARVDQFLSNLPSGLDTSVGEKGVHLSGGQRQRIAIARALIRQPKLLLLDEATSSLDTESEKLVQEALDKASTNRTCIIVAHRLSTIANSDCIVVIQNGAIVEKGTHHELMNLRGVYYGLTQKQSIPAT